MAILECPSCNKQIKIPETTIIGDGTEINCPCGAIITVGMDYDFDDSEEEEEEEED